MGDVLENDYEYIILIISVIYWCSPIWTMPTPEWTMALQMSGRPIAEKERAILIFMNILCKYQ